jgi:hypothetical protein
MTRYKFMILNFDHEFFKGVQSFNAHTIKIYLNTNSFGGWQVLKLRELQLVFLRDWL